MPRSWVPTDGWLSHHYDRNSSHTGGRVCGAAMCFMQGEALCRVEPWQQGITLANLRLYLLFAAAMPCCCQGFYPIHNKRQNPVNWRRLKEMASYLASIYRDCQIIKT